MLDLLFKIVLTPENIMGMLLDIMAIIAICMVFVELKEKWWKSFIPFYNTFLLYKHTWKYKWFCLLEFLCLFGKSKSYSRIKKEVFMSAYDVLVSIINQEEILLDFNVALVIVCMMGTIVFGITVFAMKRITYWKVAKKFNYNLFKTILVCFLPIFFLPFIAIRKIKEKREKRKAMV